MKLVKFTVVEIKREVTEAKFFKGFDTTREYKEKRHTTLMKDENGNWYKKWLDRTPMKIRVGQVFRGFISELETRFKDGLVCKKIDWHPIYKEYNLSAYKFEKARQDYIERNKKTIEMAQKEIERLENLN